MVALKVLTFKLHAMLEQFQQFELQNSHKIKGGTADGYFGRVHGDNDGIPPDGEIRTT